MTFRIQVAVRKIFFQCFWFTWLDVAVHVFFTPDDIFGLGVFCAWPAPGQEPSSVNMFCSKADKTQVTLLLKYLILKDFKLLFFFKFHPYIKKTATFLHTRPLRNESVRHVFGTKVCRLVAIGCHRPGATVITPANHSTEAIFQRVPTEKASLDASSEVFVKFHYWGREQITAAGPSGSKERLYIRTRWQVTDATLKGKK